MDWNLEDREMLTLSVFCDSDWGGDTATRKSTSGYIFCMAGGAISWSSKRQAVVSLSSTESEYVGLSLAAKEAVWLRRLVGAIGISEIYNDEPVVENMGVRQRACSVVVNYGNG
jgi:hypothetical protein